MGLLDIYIASSWRHREAVEYLTDRLRQQWHTVHSWIERGPAPGDPGVGPGWIDSPAAREKARWNLDAICGADLVIYLGPAGCDAWAEVGLAAGYGTTVWGLRRPGEPIGICRHLVERWYDDEELLLRDVGVLREALCAYPDEPDQPEAGHAG